MSKLSKHDIDYIIQNLKDGNPFLPDDFKYKIFPATHKEYELAYAGKMRKEDILANEDGVFPVPLQVEKQFNGTEYKAFDDGWKNMIVFGDNLQFLKTIFENKDPLIKDKVKNKVKLIYIDPPFATSDEFQNKVGAKAYTDKKKGADFVEFLRRRLLVAKEILADDGSIYVHLDSKMSHYVKILMDEIFGKTYFKAGLTWEYQGSWVEPENNFPKRSQKILYYTKSSNFIFNQLFEKEKTEQGVIKRWDKYIIDGKIYGKNAPYKDGKFEPYLNKFKKKKGREPKPMKSAFDLEDRYELTSLGEQFIHYAMNDLPLRIEYKNPFD